ncbi:MAG: hypothetical protein F6K19_01680 [Cyanothece sp. SIO1E1]|nr:hypothetical protein [Cyanothece sp. SIO1E1]
MSTYSAPVDNVYDLPLLTPETVLMQRDIRQELFKRYSEQDIVLDFLIHSGRKKMTKAPEYYHFEKGYIVGEGEVESVSGSNADGAAATITLEESSHYESGKKTFFTVGQVVRIGTSGYQGLITAKDTTTDNAHTITVEPFDNVNIVGNIAQGDHIGVIGSAYADGTGQPEGFTQLPIEKKNQVQIFKDQFKAHGQASAWQTEVLFGGRPFMMHDGVEDTYMRHKLLLETSVLWGQLGTRLDAQGNEVKTTRGVEEYIDTEGLAAETYTAGTWDFSNFKSVEKKLDNEQAPNEIMWLMGNEIMLDSLDVLFSKNIDTAVQYVSNSGEGSTKIADFNFQGFKYGSRKHIFKKMKVFNYKPISGFDGSRWPGTFFVIPLHKIRNEKPSEGNNYVDSICLRYMNNGQKDRLHESWVRGRKITNLDQDEFNYASELGLQMAGMNSSLKGYAV